MMSNFKNVLWASLFVYVLAASIVFRLRHPNATETQIIGHVDSVLMFQKVEELGGNQ